MPEITGGSGSGHDRYACANCDQPIQEGRIFYRLMLAVQKTSSTARYISMGRMVDAYVCATCISAALHAIPHVPVTRRWRDAAHNQG